MIAYYHQHKEEIDAYIQWIHEDSERIRKEVEASYPPEHRALIERTKKLRKEQKQKT